MESKPTEEGALMSDEERAIGKEVPAKEGYQPTEKKHGYQPQQQNPDPTPPQGGSGVPASPPSGEPESAES
jgi:hypothetical protein